MAERHPLNNANYKNPTAPSDFSVGITPHWVSNGLYPIEALALLQNYLDAESINYLVNNHDSKSFMYEKKNVWNNAPTNQYNRGEKLTNRYRQDSQGESMCDSDESDSDHRSDIDRINMKKRVRKRTAIKDNTDYLVNNHDSESFMYETKNVWNNASKNEYSRGEKLTNRYRQDSQEDSLCDSDESDSDNRSNIDRIYMKKRVRKRTAIKGASIAAWVFMFPVMVGLNLLRGRNDDDDEDDKQDDPLRPWNYNVKYVAPHKR